MGGWKIGLTRLLSHLLCRARFLPAAHTFAKREVEIANGHRLWGPLGDWSTERGRRMQLGGRWREIVWPALWQGFPPDDLSRLEGGRGGG